MTSLITKTFVKSLTNICNVSKYSHTSVRLTSNGKYQAAVMKFKDAKELVLEDLKRPKLSPTQVRMQVAYCSVNIFDVHKFNEGNHKFPFVPGYEFSGEIIEAGKEAAAFYKKNDRIVALSLTDYGGMAKECVVDYREIWLTPASIDLKMAAVLPYSYAMALYTFGVRAPIKENNNVVVSVGPAGMGLAAVEVAANIYKAKVIAVTDTEQASQLTRDKGAFNTYHYKEKLEKSVIKAFGDKRADVIFDAVGGEVHDAVTSCVTPNGQIFTPIAGKISSPPSHASLVTISLDKLKEQNFNGYRQVVQDTLEMAEQGLISAHISEKFDLKDVNKAIDFIKGKQCTGKVVVKIDD